MNASQPGADQARVPSPALLMQLGLAYRSSAVLFAAVNIDIFTLLSSGPKTAEQLAEACGADRRVAIARELTKVHEEVWRGTLGAATKHVADRFGISRRRAYDVVLTQRRAP